MRFPFQILLLFLPFFACAQKPPVIKSARCNDAAFDQKVAEMLDFSVAVMDVDSLRKHQRNFVILDARERKEFDVSHIEGARYAGYDDFDKNVVKNLSPNTPIVVYCSIGYRSEKIAARLQKQGFRKVYNLYGSIFEWVNRGYPVVDNAGKTTSKIHTYNGDWGNWVLASKMQKVW